MIAPFTLLPSFAWEKVAKGGMKAGLRQQGGLAPCTTVLLRSPALIRPAGTFSPQGEKGEGSVS